MNTSLARTGMEPLTLTATSTETVGGVEGIVAEACENLYTHARNLEGFMDELTEEMNRIVDGWEGEAAEMLSDSFPHLIEAFGEIPPSIVSVANWATTNMNNIVSADSTAASLLSEISGRS